LRLGCWEEYHPADEAMVHVLFPTVRRAETAWHITESVDKARLFDMTIVNEWTWIMVLLCLYLWFWGSGRMALPVIPLAVQYRVSLTKREIAA